MFGHVLYAEHTNDSQGAQPRATRIRVNAAGKSRTGLEKELATWNMAYLRMPGRMAGKISNRENELCMEYAYHGGV